MKEEQIWILISKKITGEATPEELKTLEEALLENAVWQKDISVLEEVWHSAPLPKDIYTEKKSDAYLSHVNRLKEKAADFKEYSDFKYEEPTVVPFYKNWKSYLTAASIAAISFVSVYFLQLDNNSNIRIQKPLNEVKVSNGTKSKIVLPDGSQVWINSGSKLTYDNSFKENIREVTLNGEAYFDVVKDKKHPFIVHANGIDIKVLGTVFNVKAYEKDPTIEATLIHGSIEVVNTNVPNSPKLLMIPHEKMVFNKLGNANEKAKQAVVETKNASNNSSMVITKLPRKFSDTTIVETAWVYNKLVFEDEKFSDVALKMERWYNVTINITDEKLKNEKISGSFVDETVDEALKILQLVVSFKFKKNSNDITISKK